MRFFKMTLPITLAFVMAVMAITSNFIAHHYSNNFRQETTVWSRVMGGVTMFIGAYSLLRVHYGRIKRRQKGFAYSVILYLFFGLVVLFGALNFSILPVAGVTAQANPANGLALVQADGRPLADPDGKPLFVSRDEAAQGDRRRALTNGQGAALKSPGGKPLFVDLKTGAVTDEPPKGVRGPFKPKTTLAEGARWIYTAIQWPAGATQYSLLGFFICSAAYRTFRAKTVEAAVLLVAALIVMLGQVPIAALIWKQIPVASGWLIDVPNMAVKRAIMFGICVGSVGTSLRVMFGIERSYMGGD
jgi:hypothetical protein